MRRVGSGVMGGGETTGAEGLGCFCPVLNLVMFVLLTLAAFDSDRQK